MKTKMVKFLEIEEIKKLQEPLLERAKLAIKRNKKTVADIIAIRDFTLINLVYSCALRISEACNLTFRYLDLDNRRLYVIDGKGGDRTVPIPLPVVENLKKWLEIRPERKDNDYVFINVKGTTRPGKERPINQKYYNQLIDKLSEETGVKLRNGKTPTPHTLRHSRAMEIYDTGVDLEVLQKMLGHKEISTTQIYADVRDERVDEVQQNTLEGVLVL